MKLPVLALFERSLRVETRSALICWARAGLLVLILFLLLPVQTMARSGWIGAPGLQFLTQLVWVNLVFITLAGLSYFASAITEEKEEMMLGLLRMTDLNPVAILLGKSTSRLAGAILLLLVQVPFVLLAVALGGVGLLQIVASYGTLLAYLFLICNLALFFSVIFRTTTTAAACTFFLLLLFLIGHYWAAAILQDIGSPDPAVLNHGLWPLFAKLVDFWRRATPSDRLTEIFRTGFTGPAIGFQIVSNLMMGVTMFALSWLVFNPCTREERESAPGRRWFRRATSRPSRIPAGLVGIRAVTWKDFTFISGGKAGLLIRFGLVILLVTLCNFFVWKYGDPRDITLNFEGLALFWVSLLLAAIFLAMDVSRVFQEEMRWKTLSSLATLPFSMRELAYRKLAGTLIGTLPLLGATALGALMAAEDVGKFFNEMLRQSTFFGMFVVMILQYVLFLHLTAFLSLIIKRGALPLAVAIQYMGGSFLMGVLTMIFAFGGSRGPGLVFVITGAICAIGSVILHRAIGGRLARAAAEE